MNAGSVNTGILHLLLSADATAIADCRECSTGEDTIVLLADGVMSLAAGPQRAALGFSGRLVISEPDMRARGLPATLAEGFERVDDAAILALVASHRHCLSWV